MTYGRLPSAPGLSSLRDRAPAGLAAYAHQSPIAVEAEMDVEAAVVSLCRDAEWLGCASRDHLAPHLQMLESAQDEIARAVEKARGRLAA